MLSLKELLERHFKKAVAQFRQGLWRKTILFAFRLLYNELAWTYDAVSHLVSFGQWRDWQRAAIPFLHGSLILELAHGPGHMLVELERAEYQVVGFDLSPAMGRLASDRLRRIQAHVPLVRGKAQALPFCAGAFDSILATFPAEFIVEESTVFSLHRAIRPGGRLVVVPEATLLGSGPVHRLVEWLYVITGQRAGQDDQTKSSHLWLDVRRRFESVGFSIQVKHVKLEKSEVTVVVAKKLA